MGNRATHVKLSESDTSSPGPFSKGGASSVPPARETLPHVDGLLGLARRLRSSEIGVDELRKLLEPLNHEYVPVPVDGHPLKYCTLVQYSIYQSSYYQLYRILFR